MNLTWVPPQAVKVVVRENALVYVELLAKTIVRVLVLKVAVVLVQGNVAEVLAARYAKDQINTNQN